MPKVRWYLALQDGVEMSAWRGDRRVGWVGRESDKWYAWATKHLGLYDTQEEARAAVMAATHCPL